MNQAEVIHAGRVHQDRRGVSLLDSCYFDLRDNLLFVQEVNGFKNGIFSGGSGPTAEKKKNISFSRVMEASERFGQDIVNHGVEIIQFWCQKEAL